MNQSTREIIEREIKKLDGYIEADVKALSETRIHLAKVEAGLASHRARQAELKLDLARSSTATEE